MPCDVSDYIDDYVEILAVIANYCAIHNVNYFVIGGDLNTEFTRLNSCNTNHLPCPSLLLTNV